MKTKGKQPKLMKSGKCSNGFAGTVVVANDHNKHLVLGTAILNLNGDYTNQAITNPLKTDL
jgi:hypothetical protein